MNSLDGLTIESKEGNRRENPEKGGERERERKK
jgi:hypothetical protein